MSKFKVIALTLVISACSHIPEYQKPEVDLANSWIPASLKANLKTTNAEILGWRNFFKDPQLQAFIEIALRNNHDLRQAALNVERMAALYQISEAEQYPVIGGSASATRARANGLYGNSYSVGLAMTSFELDFFGRVKALKEAALNDYLGTKEAQDAAQLAIIKATAAAYYSARINKSLMDLSKKVMDLRAEIFRLAEAQLKGGIINAVIYRGYEGAIENARANFYAYQRNYNQAMNALSLILATPLEKLNVPAAISLNKQFAELAIPAGIPSQVLEKRPDIRQAEFSLKAANANIGAAKAALYPRIALTASLGYQSNELENLIKGPSSVWSITPSISLPIFNRTALNANVKISQIAQQQAIEAYQSAVKTAFNEVSNALIARETYFKQYEASKKVVAAQNEALKLERMRFKAGVSDGITLLDAERSSYEAEQGVLAVELAMLNNLVSLYTAMGGGLTEYRDRKSVV